MEYASLSQLIDSLEKGTKLHISIAFLSNNGNKKTLCRHDQAVHNQPVCLAIKTQRGLSACYRCRFFVQKTVIAKRRSMAGVCTGGVYEYCRPVVYEDRVCAVIFIGNILTDDPRQKERLLQYVEPQLLQTMEQSFSKEDCVQVADILESYILFLLDRYGNDNEEFEPLIENIKNYIRENAAYELSVPELAVAFNYTEKYLGRLFKAKTGLSIKEFSNKLKVNQAKKLLLETDTSIESVALQTGFNSVTYFDRVFRKVTGLSPNTYRKLTFKHKL